MVYEAVIRFTSVCLEIGASQILTHSILSLNDDEEDDFEDVVDGSASTVSSSS